MSIEAMKQALEALEISIPTTVGREAITSLRQAIAEAEKQKSVPLDNDPEKHPQFYTWTWDEWIVAASGALNTAGKNQSARSRI